MKLIAKCKVQGVKCKVNGLRGAARFALSFALLGAAPVVNAQTLAIRAETILPVSGPAIKNGVVIVRNGKIEAVGSGLSIPAGARVLRAAVVMPGLVDAHSCLGCANETDEMADSLTPDLRACDAFDPQSPLLRKAIAAGITTACLSPGNANVIGGQAATVRLRPTPQILNGYAAQKFSLSSDAANSQRNPTSRAGVIAIARASLASARSGVGVTGSRQPILLAGDIPTSLSERPAALMAVLSGKTQTFIHAPLASDVENALLFADEFHLRPVLLHVTQGDRAAASLKSHGATVVVGPLGFDDNERALRNPGVLSKAGVKVAFCTDMPRSDAGSLRMTAHLAVKYGMSPEAALRGLTLSAAEAIGLGARTGSIQMGKDADLLLLTGDPLDLTSRVTAVISGGQVVFTSGSGK